MENVPGDPAPLLRASRIELVDGNGLCQMRLTPGAIQIMGSVVFTDETGVVFGELGTLADRSWFHLGNTAQLRLAACADEANLIVASGTTSTDTSDSDGRTVEVMMEARSGWSEREDVSPACGGLSIRFAGEVDEALRLQSQMSPNPPKPPRPRNDSGGTSRHCR